MREILIKNQQIDMYEIVEFYVKHYPDKMKIFKYKNPFSKKKDGFESKQKPEAVPAILSGYDIDNLGRIFNQNTGEYTDPEKIKEQNKQKNNASSIRRTKTAISDLVQCNDFDYFATFTFNAAKIDRYDVKKCSAALSVWFKNLQRIHGKFSYLVVPEYHKDGAIHFHAVLKGYTGKLERAYSPKTGKPIFRGGRRPQFNSSSWKLGHSQFDPIGDKDKTSSYIRKYITKDLVSDSNGKKRYWHSDDLKTPLITYNTASYYENTLPPTMNEQTKVHENDIFEIHEILTPKNEPV